MQECTLFPLSCPCYYSIQHGLSLSHCSFGSCMLVDFSLLLLLFLLLLHPSLSKCSSLNWFPLLVTAFVAAAISSIVKNHHFPAIDIGSHFKFYVLLCCLSLSICLSSTYVNSFFFHLLLFFLLLFHPSSLWLLQHPSLSIHFPLLSICFHFLLLFFLLLFRIHGHCWLLFLINVEGWAGRILFPNKKNEL